MKKVISALLSSILLLTISTSILGGHLAPERGAIAQSQIISSGDTQAIVGQGDKSKKFLYGFACGVGIFATVAGYAGGVFTGGLSTVITGLTIAGATAAACAEATS